MQARNNKIRRYVKALVGSLAKAKTRKEAKAQMSNFFALVKRRGDTKFLQACLVGVQNEYKAKGKKVVEMVSAAPLSLTTQKKALSILKPKGFGAITVRVNPQLLGGIAIFLGNEYLMDGTLREKLYRMFL
ncbi:MAG: F0F1 ATP synthase subunit delta [Parcubacteria group bacterium]|nr:F0F1 ATP synthase subunit delta [Parcubacteria group bacterium]